MPELSEVRGAVPEDEAAILDLCFSLHDEIALWSLNKDKVREFVHCGVHKVSTPNVPSYPTIGVVGEIGKPEGAICFGLMQQWFSDEWFIGEYFLYIHPDYRRAGHSSRLINFAKQCADQMDLSFSIGVLSTHRTQAKIRIFRRSLGEPSGAFFTYFPPNKRKEQAA